MKYKLIALDVDGTLLTDDQRLTENTAQTIREASSARARVVLCTGRSPVNAIPVFRNLGLEGVLITHNGAVIVETAGPKLLHQFTFSIANVAPVISFCRDSGIHFDTCTAFDIYTEQMGEKAAAMYGKYVLFPTSVEDVLSLRTPVVKFTMFGSRDQMDHAERELSVMDLPADIQSLRSDEQCIDVVAAGVSKGTALKRLSSLWNIHPSEIIAMGNYFNDVEMIRFAGLGIAMENAPDLVKLAADEVTFSNNEEGVYHALMRHVLSPSREKRNSANSFAAKPQR